MLISEKKFKIPGSDDPYSLKFSQFQEVSVSGDQIIGPCRQHAT